ncbi:MAG: Gfo/Idh/MocA family oxidoreductase, partial [Clostridia bacterium]|nr:Gfo/Idh/MocA family oxidoreductase [Clostridia bacterium]
PDVIWEGVVDPYFEASQFKEHIEAQNVPVYDTMEEFYAHHEADLAIISTPTFLHCEQSICALKHNTNVLCEKPAAPIPEQALQMLEAEKETGLFLAIGYQWSYSDAIRKLKADILNGVLGKPEEFRTMISWPRSRKYYNRGSGWGGKIQKDGKWILDSIASNACAHYLHNMFFLLGDTMETSAKIADFQAECYRANEIENFDTCSIRLQTESGVKLYYAASHAAGERRDPEFIYRFSNADVTFAVGKDTEITAHFKDGTTKIYGNPNENVLIKMWDSIDAVRNGTRPVCTIETAIPHVQFIYDMYKTTPIHTFDSQYIRVNEEEDTVYVDGLFEQLGNAYDNGQLFSESGSEIFKV